MRSSAKNLLYLGASIASAGVAFAFVAFGVVGLANGGNGTVRDWILLCVGIAFAYLAVFLFRRAQKPIRDRLPMYLSAVDNRGG